MILIKLNYDALFEIMLTTPKNTLALLVCNTILLSSCISSDRVEPVLPSGEVALKGATRTYDSKLVDFQDGEKIGLYAVAQINPTTAGMLLPTGNTFDNLEMTVADGIFKPAGSNSYPTGTTHVALFAYAPYQSGTLGSDKGLSFSVQTNQSDVGKQKKSDLLWSNLPQAATASGIPGLTFDHKLSKLTVTLVAGPGVTLNSPTLTVDGTKPAVRLNMATGTMIGAATGGVVTIIPLAKGGNMYEAIIAPQQVNAGTRLFTVTNNAKTYHHNLTAVKTFSPGNDYKYRITVNSRDVEVELTGTINGWGDGGTTAEDVTE